MHEQVAQKTSDTLPIVLASTSQYRRELLSRLRIPFTCTAPSGVDETPLTDEPAFALVQRLSQRKAEAVAEQHPAALIIGSDQVAWCESTILGKPLDFDRGCAQLQFLSGKTVTFYTGLCLLNSATGQRQVAVVPFHVKFRDLTKQMIARYLHAEEPYNCAGSFKSEGLGIALFRAMTGDDPTALIGLPLIKLTQLLEHEHYAVL